MWNNNIEGGEDESWEVRAFKEDTSRLNLMGCTWPPPSYSCTFCWREFRSAQALGGHMNVHRRDRAKLNVAKVTDPPPNPNLDTGKGLCLIYTAPNPSGIFIPTGAGAMEQCHGVDIQQCDNETYVEEVDLELRLGPKSTPPKRRRDTYA